MFHCRVSETFLRGWEVATLQPPRCDTELRAPPSLFHRVEKSQVCHPRLLESDTLVGCPRVSGGDLQICFLANRLFWSLESLQRFTKLTCPIQFGSWEDEFIFPLWWDM